MPTKLTAKTNDSKLYVVCFDTKAIESISESIKENHFVVSKAWLDQYREN